MKELQSNQQGRVAKVERPAGWLARAKAAIQEGVILAAEAMGTLASAIGAPVAAITGKLYLAALVALFGIGCFLRFVRLRQRRRQTSESLSSMAFPWRAPGWLTPVVMAVSAVEVALLVEATRLPVRADQPGFGAANWWWVIAGFVLLFWLQRGWLSDRLSVKVGTDH